MFYLYLFLFLLFLLVVYAVAYFFIAYIWITLPLLIFIIFISYRYYVESKTREYNYSDLELGRVTFEKSATTTEKAKFRALFKDFTEEYYTEILQKGKNFVISEDIELNDYEVYEVLFGVKNGELNLGLNDELVLAREIRFIK